MRREVYDADGVLVEVEEVEVPTAPAPSVDLVAIADDLEAQRTRLTAAEDALNFLILNALEGL